MDIKCRVISRACAIRMSRGEKLEDILASYPALTKTEKAEIRAEILKKGAKRES